MNKLKFLFFGLLLILITANFVSAQNSTCIYFFHGDGCPHCAKVESSINNIKLYSQSSLDIHRFEIYNNRSNMLLLNQYFDIYNISNSERGIPAVLIGDSYLIRDSPILENLIGLMGQNYGVECPDFQTKNGEGKGILLLWKS